MDDPSFPAYAPPARAQNTAFHYWIDGGRDRSFPFYARQQQHAIYGGEGEESVCCMRCAILRQKRWRKEEGGERRGRRAHHHQSGRGPIKRKEEEEEAKAHFSAYIEENISSPSSKKTWKRVPSFPFSRRIFPFPLLQT